MEHPTRIFIDTSKQLFQLHGVDAAEKVVVRRRLRRREMIPFFARLAATRIGMEACGGAHYWARELSKLGHEVVLLPAQYVKAYLKRGKNDGRDAEAGCEAMSRPTMRTVPVKTAEEQAVLMLLRTREQLVRGRTQLTNAIRGHAAEFGLIATRGLDKIEPLLERIATEPDLPELARELFAGQGRQHQALQVEIDQIDARLARHHRSDPMSRMLAKIPSVGMVGAVMLAAKTPDPKAFRSARDFAAWLGLTPKDHSTAGKTRLGIITRAGDEALRSVLVCGAMAVIQQAKAGRGKPWPWLNTLLQKKPPKQAAVALANKTARIAWRIMVSGQPYDPARHFALQPAA